MDLTWRHHHPRISPSHLQLRSSTKFKHIALFKVRPSRTQLQRCNRPSLPQKKLKSINVPIHLSCHFSVWTKHKGTLKPKLEILIYMRDQYLSATSNINLSPTQSHNIKILFRCDIWIRPQTRITAVGKWGFTNTLQN